MTESGNNDVLVADILAHTAKHYVVIDIGGMNRNILLVYPFLHPLIRVCLYVLAGFCLPCLLDSDNLSLPEYLNVHIEQVTVCNIVY